MCLLSSLIFIFFPFPIFLKFFLKFLCFFKPNKSRSPKISQCIHILRTINEKRFEITNKFNTIRLKKTVRTLKKRTSKVWWYILNFCPLENLRAVILPNLKELNLCHRGIKIKPFSKFFRAFNYSLFLG